MTTEQFSCPYCNALIPRPASIGPVTCPRCGEAYRWQDRLAAAANGQAGVVIPPPASPSAAPMRWPLQLAGLSAALVAISLVLKVALPDSGTAQRGFPFMVILSGMGLVASLWLWFLRKPRSNVVLALFVLGNMACVALMIIPPAVMWTAFRRGNDPQPISIPPPPAPVEMTPVAPATLAALGYLPDDCNLVAAIYIADLAADPIVGKALLAPAKNGEASPWLIDLAVGRVEKLTGMKTEAVDHVVIGTRIDAGLPQLMIVVRTSKPYDPTVVAKAQRPRCL